MIPTLPPFIYSKHEFLQIGTEMPEIKLAAGLEIFFIKADVPPKCDNKTLYNYLLKVNS